MPRHTETRDLPYSPDQMYDLVADVASYPQFLPWTAAARIRSRTGGPEGEVVLADLVISFKVFREKFGSKVTLWPGEKRIETEYLDGPFRHLESEWRFETLPNGGCRVHFWVDFEFRNALIGRVVGVVFNEAMQRVVAAFEKRAKALYGAV
ncbi:type II toxin-antitoxin system RatA family toxin [Jannaschia sp. M317]|uniref:type II toxin-antitoxin system RatA family toxin n=1 Tax=Jannaschia sp. M317 TaxID=2867011 RepID=UPI0021A84540|nr:type II toxin-antitoxin system RatA family toxin [Jannaschia sp. M317]UWQ16736.1 type II toxin-antitoxin system RatA family toxin [Jannaschia sp. M317]